MTEKEDRSSLQVMFTSQDMKRSISFYRDKLGFQLAEVWPVEDNAKWANMQLDNQSIMLGAQMSPESVSEMCSGDEAVVKWMKTQAEEFPKNRPGVGILTYVLVPDVDTYHAEITSRGVRTAGKPDSKFYGIRDFGLEDPDGYRLMFYQPIQMNMCQSCGMPLKGAKPGDMYCPHCVDENGRLRPYEAVFEGCVTGFFMGMQKMSRSEAEKAARAHLGKMPAWAGRE